MKVAKMCVRVTQYQHKHASCVTMFSCCLMPNTPTTRHLTTTVMRNQAGQSYLTQEITEYPIEKHLHR